MNLKNVLLDTKGTEYGEFHADYVAKGRALAETMDMLQHGSGMVRLLKDIPKDKQTFRYDVGKWSIKELIGHLIDSERVFAYRAMCFARGEKQSQPGFSENDYVVRSNAHHRSMDELLEEFISVRVATHHMFNSFDDAMLKSTGVACDTEVSVRATYLIIMGHAMHHMAIIKERYL